MDIKVNNNFKISMNLSLAEKLPIFLCSTVILTVKTNEWTQIEFQLIKQPYKVFYSASISMQTS